MQQTLDGKRRGICILLKLVISTCSGRWDHSIRWFPRRASCYLNRPCPVCLEKPAMTQDSSNPLLAASAIQRHVRAVWTRPLRVGPARKCAHPSAADVRIGHVASWKCVEIVAKSFRRISVQLDWTLPLARQEFTP